MRGKVASNEMIRLWKVFLAIALLCFSLAVGVAFTSGSLANDLIGAFLLCLLGGGIVLGRIAMRMAHGYGVSGRRLAFCAGFFLGLLGVWATEWLAIRRCKKLTDD